MAKEVAVIDLDKFKVEQLPELKNKKAEVMADLAKFPHVEIVDTKTYDKAKEMRTGARSVRTGLDKERKLVKDKIKVNVLGAVDTAYEELIGEVQKIEDARQEVVTAYETILEEKRKEKERLEQERIDGIKIKINEFYDGWSDRIDLLKFEQIEEVQHNYDEAVLGFDTKSLQQYSVLFDRNIKLLDDKFASKVKTLTEQEEIRLEQIRLAEEKELSRKRKILLNSMDAFHRLWDSRIANTTLGTIEELNDLWSRVDDVDYGEFQENYIEKKKILSERIAERIAHLKFFEEQRLEREKFAQEKADFEKQQWQVKIQEREKELISLGFVQGENQDYRLGEYCMLLDDVIASSEEHYSKLMFAVKNYIEESKTPVEEKPFVFPDDLNDNSQIEETPLALDTVNEEMEIGELKELTWDDVISGSGVSSTDYYFTRLVNHLKENYNVPTPKNQ